MNDARLTDHRQAMTVLSLATAHLRHEWILTLCLVAALAAVMAPLLILLGLKHGVITTLRNRLVEDPAFREIRPAITRKYSNQWLDTYRNDHRVDFLVPGILPASSIIYASAAPKANAKANPSADKKGKRQMLDLIPTIAGDPLLLENGSPVPQEGECVLTHSAAGQLHVEVGDTVTAQVTRSMRGKSQVAKVPLRVVGVLSASANGVSGLYAPLAFVEDVEAYKEGRAVVKRQWQGNTPYPHMSFDGALVLLPKALSALTLNGLSINTGLHHGERLSGDDFTGISGLPLPKGWHSYRLTVVSGSISLSSITAVQRKLRGKQAVVLPYADGMALKRAKQPAAESASGNAASNGAASNGAASNGAAVETTATATANIPVFGLSIAPATAKKLGWEPLAWGRLNKKQLQMQRLLQIRLPQETPLGNSSKTITVDLLNSQLRDLPLTVVGKPEAASSQASASSASTLSASRKAVIPAELLGMLHTAMTRKVHYVAEESALLLEKAGYRGFRLYAKSIDDVPGLVKTFRDQEHLEVIAEAGAIERIQTLDKGLTRLFWLIATLGVVGAGAVLMASLYAAVERERKNLGILRLIGLSRQDVFWFPIFQGGLIALIGMGVSVLGYAILSLVINYAFGHELPGDEAICRLPLWYFAGALLAVLLLAALSALVAAWKTTNIETAEAIREE